MTPDLQIRLKALAEDRFAALVVVGFVAVICWVTWALAPRPGVTATALDATIRQMWPSNSRSANSHGAPRVNLEVETADGRHLGLASDSRLIWNCRTGGQIHLVTSRTNLGSERYDLALRPCDS